MRRNSRRYGLSLSSTGAEGKPALWLIHRPADLCLNGECADADGYFIEEIDLVAV
jgi:hypothetical protein